MRVLVVKLTSMGDLVQALPALTDACAAHPGIRFDWVADEAFAEVPAWHAAVERVIPTAHRRWKSDWAATIGSGELAAAIRAVRATRYDAVIDAQANIKSAVITALARGSKHGLDRRSAREFPAHWSYRHRYAIARDRLAVDRWRELFACALTYPLPAAAPDFGLAGRAWPRVEPPTARRYLVAVPNASWENKCWNDSHWRGIMTRAAAAGLDVLLTSGNERERQRCLTIARGQTNAHVLPFHDLTTLAALLTGSRGAICMDTGLAHVAAALNVPTVTLYGPTDPRLIGATGGCTRHLQAPGFSCMPCYRRECAVGDYRGARARCLESITSDTVWSAFTALADMTQPETPDVERLLCR